MNDTATGAGKFAIRRLWPLAAIALATGLFFGFGLDRYFAVETLRLHREALQLFVADHAALAALAYVGLYLLVTAVSFPAGSLLTLAGGFLFGAGPATVYAVIGATLGATLLFVAAKTSLGEPLRRRTKGFLRRMEDGFAESAFSYLLVLRLIPAFPFWVVNLVPAFVGVRVGTYVAGTFIGIIPGTFVYALAGSGLGEILDSGESLGIERVITPQIVAALVGLAILSLLPVVYKRIKARRG